MTMSITYLSKGNQAVYADARGMKRFTTKDFPVLDLLVPYITEPQFYFKLRDAYVGESMNPFMTEAFIAAIKVGNRTVFEIDRLSTQMTTAGRIAKRFGLNPVRFTSLSEVLSEIFPQLRDENLYYYTATFYMGCMDADRTERTGNANRVTRALELLKNREVNTMPGYEQLALLKKVDSALVDSSPNSPRSRGAKLFATDPTFDAHWRAAEQTMASLLMFKTDEIRTITETLPKESWLATGRIKDAMGCADYAEVAELMESMAPSIIDGLLPPWK